MLARIERALVLAPHPDDEVLGCGGTIARLVARGADVQIGVVTRGMQPQFDLEQVEQVRSEAERAHRSLGVSRVHYLDLPAARLDTLPRADLNRAIGDLVQSVAPDTLFVPFAGDLHFDHKLVYEAAMVAARPRDDRGPARVLAYETLSETNWSGPNMGPGFAPNIFVDITNYIEAKRAAFACFESQCRAFPDERSITALTALAQMRGATVHRQAAEAFVLIREIG
ncbi:MAG TPA: PIG-L deacetylase family protein [Sphingomonas sp.]|jgi:LmbE family N-acetylglucosaminyl deacetylase|nr:PIG-L deacetylase family protein [Sphingomonas sp.]